MLYEIGDLARLSVTFKDLTGVVTDPTVVDLTVQAPDDTQSTPSGGSIINDSIGVYYYDLNITQSGKYLYRWTGTGAVQAVKEGSITVVPSILVPTAPTLTPADFTQANLDAINAAIASGTNRVKFADREIQYNTLDDLIRARNLVKDYLGAQQAAPARRQIRVVTGDGWG